MRGRIRQKGMTLPSPYTGEPWKRRYIYNQALCGRCGRKVSTWEMAARRVYACQTCQPLPQDTVISPARSKALAASTPTKVLFDSAGYKCASCCPKSVTSPAHSRVLVCQYARCGAITFLLSASKLKSARDQTYLLAA